MRLLLVIDNLGWGGSQRQMANLAVGLRQRGHDVHLFHYLPRYDHYRPLVAGAGVTLIDFEKHGKLDQRAPVALARAARRLGAQALIAFLPTPSAYAVLVGRLLGLPVIASERSFFLPAPLPAAVRLRCQLHRLAAHVTTNSHHQRERLLLEFPWLRGRCSTIWNGVDTKTFRPREAPPSADHLRVLGVGTVGPVKEIELLAAALVELRRTGGPSVSVAWAGHLLDEPASRAVRERVDALLAAHRLTDRWRWLGLRTDVAELYAGHDVLVHPSATEGLPNALCEGLASGVPIVAARAADHPLLVGAAERGELFEPGDPTSLAAALRRLCALGPAARREMGARARAFAEAELSLDRYVEHYETLVASLLAADPRPGRRAA
jgi:GalNAc-alpha-(1->4)-GalNAc-alpha-(1->3)-diNAcBac-PP-undecaprenol alpha-1,4-N-acetyl-D-galactosaminyltransferase